MTKPTLIKWEAVGSINDACTDISFTYGSGAHATLAIRMHFSRLKGAAQRDLLITFKSPIGFRWDEEGPYCLESLPPVQSMPKLETGEHPTWTFPLLLLESSPWVAKHLQVRAGAKLNHYVFISLNDTVEVLGEKDAKAE